MCCPGCKAVASAIVAAGLQGYYRHRTGNPDRVQEALPEFLQEITIYDNPEVQKQFVVHEGDVSEASLILENIVCAACVWLTEKHLQQLPGIISASVNYSTGRARVRWDKTKIKLSKIIEAVAAIGYRAHPYDPNRQQALFERERSRYLKRLAVAGALGMQVMILAVALYGGEWWTIETRFKHFFQWLSLGLTLPIITYAAQPFFISAWRDLMRAHAGMDVPVTLGISIAFIASTWAIFTGKGDVYFDSVAMFVFFLLSARFLELAARKKSSETMEALTRITPLMATRITETGEEVVPVNELVINDSVLVRAGETVPIDGKLVEGRSSLDESLVTGESMPVTKDIGDMVIGGTINRESPVTLQVIQIGQDTVLATMMRLLDRAQAEKPTIALLTDRIAGHFVTAILLLAVVVAGYWWSRGSDQWLAITIALLVVTCPCALSLATPSAMSVVTGRLSALGLLTVRGHALETLARCTHFVFDKTGTLTQGELKLLKVHPFGEYHADQCLRIAAILEWQSEHPIAQALRNATAAPVTSIAADVINTPGSGMCGRVDGKYYAIGTPAFVKGKTGAGFDSNSLTALQNQGHSVVVLASNNEALAAFVLGDVMRKHTATVIQQLKLAGISCSVLSGDQQAAVRNVANILGIDKPVWEATPEDKLKYVQRLQQDGATVAMIGDGINDAPVMGAAHLSVAMGSGTQLATATADMILLGQHLTPLLQGRGLAQKALGIIKQNIAWALLYNAIALPLAALGYIAPWMAALGMSASSLVVIGNALRLRSLKT